MKQDVRTLERTWKATQWAERFSSRLAGFFAARLWFTPWHLEVAPHVIERERNWLAATEPFSLGFRGRTLRGYTAGDGPPVFLVHGWGERASTMGSFVEPLTGRGFRVVAIDMPGHGNSDGGQTNLYEYVGVLHALAARFGDPYAVIGHSIGGAGTMLALTRWLPADRVVLLAPAVRLEHAVGKFVERFALSDRSRQGLVSAIERRFGRSVWNDLAADKHAPRLDVPALIVHDRTDDQIDFADGEMLAKAWPGARFIATEGLNHTKIVRDPEIIEMAVGFLDEADVREEELALSN